MTTRAATVATVAVLLVLLAWGQLAHAGEDCMNSVTLELEVCD